MASWKVTSYEWSGHFPEPNSFVFATLESRLIGEIEVDLRIDEDLGFRCTRLSINTEESSLNINSVSLRNLNIGEIIEVVLGRVRKDVKHIPVYETLQDLNKVISWDKQGRKPLPDLNYAVIAYTYEFFSSLGSKSVLQDIQNFLGNVEIEALKKRVAEARRRGFLKNRQESLGRHTQGALTERGVAVIGDYKISLMVEEDRRRGEKEAKQNSRNRKKR